MKHIDVNYFPGWVRKSVTFTIDDGNLRLDQKFLDMVKPAGLRGTFNLCGNLRPDEVFPALYDGFEIGNHCALHACAMNDSRRAILKDERFDPASSDPAYGYRTETEGLYRYRTYAWVVVAEDDVYLRLAKECQDNLESVFGKDRVKGFIWPCGWQDNEGLQKKLIDAGYTSLRITGNVKDSTGFALPADRMMWSYNANYTCMTEVAAAYDAYPDDGELKFFCFGVHSHDFENAGRWDVLEDFCAKYGNRPEDFWYACVGEIFEYADAVKALQITDECVKNPTDKDVFIKVDGRRVTVRRHSEVRI